MQSRDCPVRRVEELLGTEDSLLTSPVSADMKEGGLVIALPDF